MRHLLLPTGQQSLESHPLRRPQDDMAHGGLTAGARLVRSASTKYPDELALPFQCTFAEVVKMLSLGEVLCAIAGDYEGLAEFLGYYLESENGIYGVADDCGIALSGGADIAARHPAIMQRYRNSERIACRPRPLSGEREHVLRSFKCGEAVRRPTLTRAPICEHRVADEFIYRAAALGDEVPRFSKPSSQHLGKLPAWNFLRHGTETADVADQQCYGAGSELCVFGIAGNRDFQVLVRDVVDAFCETDRVVSDSDHHAILQRHWHHDALVVHECAISAAEVDDLILVAVVAADQCVLAGDEGTEVQRDGILASPTDGRCVSDRHFERVGARWLDV